MTQATKPELNSTPRKIRVRFPPYLNSWPALFLGYMLQGLTVDAEIEGAPRKAAMMGELRRRYGWPIVDIPATERRTDGRLVRVKHYKLERAVIDAVVADGRGGKWLVDFVAAAAIRKARGTSLRVIRAQGVC